MNVEKLIKAFAKALLIAHFQCLSSFLIAFNLIAEIDVRF